MLTELADAYFSFGWLAITILGFPVGYYAGKKSNWTMLAGWTTACIIIGCLAFIGKHS